MSSAEPPEVVWSVERIEAALPQTLRSRFRDEHRTFLARWEAKAQEASLGGPSASDAHAPGKWADLMDDWEL